jgi:hypothetical protein
MSSREFTEWMARDQIDPIGDLRSDLQAALVARTIAEVNRDPKRRDKPYKVEEFLLQFNAEVQEEVEPTEEELMFKANLLAAMFNNVAPGTQ